jgi:hypothetical protein
MDSMVMKNQILKEMFGNLTKNNKNIHKVEK